MSAGAAHAEESAPATATEAGSCYASGGYGFDTGLIQSITPVLVDYSLISYVTTYGCTAAQITVTAVPAVGTPTQCTLHYPDPAIGDSTGCANLLGAGGVLQYGTYVQLTARFVGVDSAGGTTTTTRACTRQAAYSMPPAVLPYYPGAGGRCTF
jgi:hypothetical protein